MISPASIHAAKVLIVDDQETSVRLLERALQSAGYTSLTRTRNPSDVCKLHREHHFDLILLDLMMPGMNGFEVMENLKEIEQGGYLPVLVVTAEPEHKLQALQVGARDFVSKPFDLAEVVMRVYNMLEVRLLYVKTQRLYEQVVAEQTEQKRLERALQEAKNAADAAEREHRRALLRAVEEPLGIVARSTEMRQVVDLARRVAKVDATVLITGESGSGKERIARLVHDESERAAGPFVAVNCGAIAETWLESELFGHARGAFTGATIARPGLFEAAHHGTLLLDEVGEVSPGMQVKLLRALQQREIRRVGENNSRKIDVRILAATNRDLALGVAGGSFRQDLYYRLKVVELHVPALRERRSDILALARVFLEDAARRMKRTMTGIAPEAAEQLLRFGWPGNVRELENAMERAVALARSELVELDDLPDEICRTVVAASPALTGEVRPLASIEQDYILSALERYGGNQTRTAEQLEIGSATLYRKLKLYGKTGGQRG
ncbi:MAG: sigma-54-dependent Fis family transcriptional regulator [Deltaproteobacteria bacterium]|nr:sigma-54-dependent Fis family transcriptional regulator [Deltaproteobacteria bacterium]